jgi:adenine specific DNA methylase Mod
MTIKCNNSSSLIRKKRLKKMKLTDNEKRDAVRFIEESKPLPEKYRFLLFDESKQVELTWNGKSDEVTNVVLPFQIIEHVDEPRSEVKVFAQNSFDFVSGRQTVGWTNKLIWGDNKYILSSLKNGPMRDEIEKNGGIKLIYIDPPFDVGADFSMNLEIGESTYEKKPNVLEHIAYRDTWGNGTDSFMSMIAERMTLMKNLLSEDGSILIHCDWRTSHLIKAFGEELFGKDRFINEIIWTYATGGASKEFLARKHDVILWFSKSANYQYFPEEIMEKRTEKSLKRAQNPTGARISSDNILKLPTDVWNVQALNPMATERTGYPTQKPEELIEKIILGFSKHNDIIADFFCGSGTTASVAEKNGRKWITTDLGKFSIHSARKRLINVQRELKKDGKDYRAFEILNLGKYQREHFIYDGKNERDELKQQEKIQKYKK